MDAAETPFFSIVVPTRNRGPVLEHALRSILAQDYPGRRFEILVVDDGSEDDSRERVLALASDEGPAVRLLEQESRGANAARNRGIREARGEHVLLIDDDIEAPPGWLRAYALGAATHPQVECFGGRIRLRLEGNPPRHCGREPFGETELELGDTAREVEAVYSANMLIRKGAWDRIGPFHESIRLAGEEVEWQMRLQADGGQVWYLPDPWVWHRRGGRSITLPYLLRARFARGKGQARFEDYVGRPYSIRRELLSMPRALAHALARGCWGGVLAFAIQAGRVAAILEMRAGHSLGPTVLPEEGPEE